MVAAFQRPLVALSLGVVLCGCPHNLDFGARGQIEDPEELLRLVEAEEAKIVTVHGDGKLKLSTPQGTGALSMFLWVSRPSFVHLETLDFFGKPQGVMTTDGTRFGLYQAQEVKYYTGPASPQNLARFLPIVMAPHELTMLMLGQPARVPYSDAKLEIDRQAGAYRLTLTAGDVTQRLWIHPRFLRAIRSEIEGPNPFTTTFEDLQPIGVTGSGIFPRLVTLEAPEARTRVELRYVEVKFNHAPDLTLFEVAPPEGVEAIEVDADFQPVPAGP